jgi:hypothetical protein
VNTSGLQVEGGEELGEDLQLLLDRVVLVVVGMEPEMVEV